VGRPVRLILEGLLTLLGIVGSLPCGAGQEQVQPPFPLPTQAPPGAHYVGPATCARCHPTEAETQPLTPMAHALESVANCTILRSHPQLAFRNGPYSYQVERRESGSTLTVSKAEEALSEPILWAFGQGQAGQTYVFKHEGSYYESRVSFFNQTQNLDLTIGHVRSVPEFLDDAAGRRLSSTEAQECFGCHSTGAVSASSRLQVENLIAGVTCEACHGPGSQHLDAVAAGRLENLHIFNPGRLKTGDLADFCGSCHRSWATVALMQTQGTMMGVVNVRFQPYRLALSRCYDQGDPRISCLACHNPHKNDEHDPVFFDATCLACHPSSAEKPASASPSRKRLAHSCRVGKQLCVSCHMPKYEMPGSHFKFTDHDIRVVRKGDSYPN
jgi:Cytochrome c554 and c-prime